MNLFGPLLSYLPAEEVFTSQTDQSQPVSESNHIPKHQSNPVRDLSTSDRAKQEKDVNDVRSLSVFSKLVECEHTENTPVSVKHGKALVVKEDLVAESIVDGSTKAIDEPDNLDLVNGDEPANLVFGTGNLLSQIDEIELIDTGAELADVVEEKDNLDTGSSNGSHSRVVKPDEAMVQKPDEKLRTGRLGLPYDLIITSKDDVTEYVEVKTTVSSQKDWESVAGALSDPDKVYDFALYLKDKFGAK
ncbi:hypothetical protein E2562_020371 [Oryza meyeriana var. granulata]|uniref:Protein NO VEIN C-terminal domain-containing protein n=1 Tax=Oryza meyeriana var. granulata TaxID=110450 RepID=A0A6G1DKQ7_9ORYZ|nr:hypothetical protein E2562_020371 [Oryza meyeriana var. granulata]